MEQFVFSMFGSISVVSARAVIFASNPVHSVLGLILAFVSACALMMMLQVEFMSLVFVVVYVGAIAVLFLFVVMMLNLGNIQTTVMSNIASWMTVFFVVACVEIVLMNHFYSSFVVELDNRNIGSYGEYKLWVELIDPFTSLNTLGQVLYTHYFLYRLMAGFVLLVARIGAIVLTLKIRTFAVSKRQQLFQQLSRDTDRAIMLVRSVK